MSKEIRNKIFNLSEGTVSGSSNWKPQKASTFWSDGTIINSKLKNLYGSQDDAPSLVDSNCIVMAVNDTIVFSSLTGWSIVSHLGTAVVIINGNTVKCTSAGTLFNLILSDGANQHVYPLAEGGYIIAFDTYSTPQHGIITCASLVWGLQSTYHKNVEGNSYRTDIDTLRQNSFVDSGNGVPVGWSIIYAGAEHTTINNIVRVKIPDAGISDYWKVNVGIPGLLTVGKTYTVTAHMRTDVARAVQVRLGAAMDYLYPTAEWSTVSVTFVATSNTTFSLFSAVWLDAGAWFEFDSIVISEAAAVTYFVPKRIGANVDAQGSALSIIGNGNFIDCETKLLFPDSLKYQQIGENMDFFYTTYRVQRKLGYIDLYENPFGLDRVFIEKTSGRVTRFIVVNPKSMSRDHFKSFMTEIGFPNYIYTKITKGALVYFALQSATDTSIIITEQERQVLKTKGVLMSPMMTYSLLPLLDAEGLARLVQWSHESSLFSQRDNAHGCTSFEFSTGEEALYADEIASGDLIAIDVPGSKRGGYSKIDFPNFVTSGQLISTTKQNGTVILDNAAVYGYSPIIWIPAGQSGVPAALSEVPLSTVQADATDKRLRFRNWAADELFGVTFTNTNAINVYLLGYQYIDLVSAIGQKCVIDHLRREYESFNSQLKLKGWLEMHPGELVGAGVSSEAIYDAGILYGSSGKTLSDAKSKIFANQNAPRTWCAYFGHTLWGSDGLATILNTNLPAAALSNAINSVDMLGWGVATINDFNSVIAKCDELGMLFLSPVDFIKNLQFNDYNESDFWK